MEAGSAGQDELVELTENVRMLTDVTSHFQAELQKRPTKWTTEILDLGDRAYRLLSPLPVLVEEYAEDEMVYARVPELEVFGEGLTDSEAIFNLKLAILDLYDELAEANPAELGPLPEAWLRILTRMIAKD